MPTQASKWSLLFVLCVSARVQGQTLGADVQALLGEPFGIAEVTVPYPDQDLGNPVGRAVVTVSDSAGRVRYPAVTDGVTRRLLSSGPSRRSQITVMFLFTGLEPMDVSICTPSQQTVRIEPQSASRLAHRRLLRRWWRGYSDLFADLGRENEHPPILETYLTSMLGGRLDLDESLVERLAADERGAEPGESPLELLAGAESTRSRIMRAICLGILRDTGTADLPVPEGLRLASGSWPTPGADVEVEPLALRVPEECFYVRFGQFTNFNWFTTLLEEYGGEISSMASARGYRMELRERIEKQLALEQGMLAELLGPQAVSDVAAIGLDTFTRDGAALALLFETSGPLFSVDLARQRSAALARERDHGATMTQVAFGDRQVALISTPDNRLRSFHAVDGKYHLITNSSTLVKRFFEVADGSGSLGKSAEFRHARSVAPVSRADTILVYFPTAFFRNLLSAPYQIELRRRLLAATECQLVTLASLAAAAQGAAHSSLSDLLSADVLPAGFGQRPDGSQPVVQDGRAIDSLRGARGYFTPIPDMVLQGVTPAERERCVEQRQYYGENEQYFDPILIALKNASLEQDGCERVTVDAYVTPSGGFKVRTLVSFLGEPSAHKLVPPAGNMICLDAAVRGGIVFRSIPPHRLFLALQDLEPRSEFLTTDPLRLLSLIRTAPGFLGAWPKPGFLDLIPFLSSVPDEEGYSQLPFNVQRWQGRGFSVLALNRALLEQADREIGFLEEESPAHVRIQAADLSQARFASWLNRIAFHRALQVSVSNAQQMSVLQQQLGVPLAQTRQVLEEVLDARLVCPLGGQYEVVAHHRGAMLRSTAWPDSDMEAAAASYTAPPLRWFRGMRARLVMHGDRAVLHGYLDMQRSKPPSGIKLFSKYNPVSTRASTN